MSPALLDSHNLSRHAFRTFRIEFQVENFLCCPTNGFQGKLLQFIFYPHRNLAVTYYGGSFLFFVQFQLNILAFNMIKRLGNRRNFNALQLVKRILNSLVVRDYMRASARSYGSLLKFYAETKHF